MSKKTASTTFDDVYFDFNNDMIWPKTKDKQDSPSSTPSTKRRHSTSRSLRKGQRSRQKNRKPNHSKNRNTRPSSANATFVSQKFIPGPFSFYTTNEVFVEDVYPHVKLDTAYMQRPVLKRSSTAPVQLLNNNRKSRLNDLNKFSPHSRNKLHKSSTHSNANIFVNQNKTRASPLQLIPKSTKTLRKELKETASNKRLTKRFSAQTSTSVLNEKKRRQDMIESMLQQTTLLSPVPEYKSRRPVLALNDNMNFIPEKRVEQLRNNIKARKKYNTELRIKIKQHTRIIKRMKRKNKKFQKKGLKHVYDAFKKEHAIGTKLIQENKLLLSHKNKINSKFTDSEIEGNDHDEVPENERAKSLRGLKYPDTDADSIFKNLPKGVDDLLEQQEDLLKKLLHKNANKLKYQPTAFPVRPLSRSRKIRLSGTDTTNRFNDNKCEPIIDRRNPINNKNTWAMMTFDSNTIRKKKDEIVGLKRM
jgi:hypothetical protein